MERGGGGNLGYGRSALQVVGMRRVESASGGKQNLESSTLIGCQSTKRSVTMNLSMSTRGIVRKCFTVVSVV